MSLYFVLYCSFIYLVLLNYHIYYYNNMYYFIIYKFNFFRTLKQQSGTNHLRQGKKSCEKFPTVCDGKHWRWSDAGISDMSIPKRISGDIWWAGDNKQNITDIIVYSSKMCVVLQYHYTLWSSVWLFYNTNNYKKEKMLTI